MFFDLFKKPAKLIKLIKKKSPPAARRRGGRGDKDRKQKGFLFCPKFYLFIIY
jgi:hypothetical protein